MHMTKTITVHNKSSAVQNFLLFNSPPTKPASVGIRSNVWAKSPGVGHPNGETTFTITSSLYAVCGMTDGTLADGVRMSTSDSYQVITATPTTSGTKVIADIEDGGAVFKSPAATTSVAGCFSIATATYSAIKYRMSSFSMPSYF
jgi:hypothetical protein